MRKTETYKGYFSLPIELLTIFVMLVPSLGNSAVPTTTSCQTILLSESGPVETGHAKLESEIRSQILEKHYAVVDVSELLAKQILPAWRSVDENQSWTLTEDQFGYMIGLGGQEVPISLQSMQKGLGDLRETLRGIIQKAITDLITLDSGEAELRTTPSGVKSVDPNGWHLDGPQLNITISIENEGMEVLGLAPVFDGERNGSNWEWYRRNNPANWEYGCRDCKPFLVPKYHAVIFLEPTQPFLNTYAR